MSSARTLMPERYTRRQKVDDISSVVNYTQTIISEDAAGIFRPSRFLRAEKKPGPGDPEKPGQLLKVEYTGEVKFPWLQFNESTLKLPDIESFGKTPSVWAEFLKLQNE